MAFPLNYIKLSGLKLAVFIECLDFSKLTNQVSDSQYRGVISLLPKPGKDKLSASNYRQIILLNCDYRIISKLITNRIDPFLNDLRVKQQNGFMKARNIGNNLC